MTYSKATYMAKVCIGATRLGWVCYMATIQYKKKLYTTIQRLVYIQGYSIHKGLGKGAAKLLPRLLQGYIHKAGKATRLIYKGLLRLLGYKVTWLGYKAT